jgi:hypothetical protein
MPPRGRGEEWINAIQNPGHWEAAHPDGALRLIAAQHLLK